MITGSIVHINELENMLFLYFMNAAIKLLLFLNIILGIEKYIILITFNYQKLHIIKITKSEKLENKLITFSNILRGYEIFASEEDRKLMLELGIIISVNVTFITF